MTHPVWALVHSEEQNKHPDMDGHPGTRRKGKRKRGTSEAEEYIRTGDTSFCQPACAFTFLMFILSCHLTENRNENMRVVKIRYRMSLSHLRTHTHKAFSFVFEHQVVRQGHTNRHLPNTTRQDMISVFAKRRNCVKREEPLIFQRCLSDRGPSCE